MSIWNQWKQEIIIVTDCLHSFQTKTEKEKFLFILFQIINSPLSLLYDLWLIITYLRSVWTFFENKNDAFSHHWLASFSNRQQIALIFVFYEILPKGFFSQVELTSSLFFVCISVKKWHFFDISLMIFLAFETSNNTHET